MGFFFSKRWNKLFEKQEVRIIMVGLDSAGKTTVLTTVEMGERIKTISNNGFNVETLNYKKLFFKAWDLKGDNDKRVFYKQYYENIDGIIFVVDSNDRENIEKASDELKKMIEEEELKESLILVMANKQDLGGVMTPEEVSEKLGMSKIKGREWLVQGTSAKTGQGISEGFDWIAEVLLKKY